MDYIKFAATSIGPKYADKGWQCQDASDTLAFEKVRAVAVADGHGGSNYFRSEIGSRTAIDVVFEQIKLSCKDLTEIDRLSETGIKKFKYDVANEWRRAVKADWYEHLQNGKALGEGEVRYEAVKEDYRAYFTSDDPNVVEKYLYSAYGTTLLCALFTGTQILILQIGDGTCMVLHKDGEWSVPIPPDEDNNLNVTASLSSSKAELKIRHAILDCEDNAPNLPAAIFLSTDGLDDCFPYYQNEEHLRKFYTNVVLDNIMEVGLETTAEEIKNELLEKMTKRFSQDDISMGYLIADDVALLKEAYDNIDGCYKSSEQKEVNQ